MSPELSGEFFNTSTIWKALSMRLQHLKIMLAYYLLLDGGTWKQSILQNIEKLFWQMRENGLENEIYFQVNYLNSVSIQLCSLPKHLTVTKKVYKKCSVNFKFQQIFDLKNSNLDFFFFFCISICLCILCPLALDCHVTYSSFIFTQGSLSLCLAQVSYNCFNVREAIAMIS